MSFAAALPLGVLTAAQPPTTSRSNPPTVTLGSFVFGAFEVPDHIPFGGEQLSAVHQLIGGARVIDAMGRSDRMIEWSGRFQGKDAIDRARYLDGLRIAGRQLGLTWAQFNYTGLLKRFDADYHADWEVPYSLAFEIAVDNASPVTSAPGPSLDDQVADDVGSATGLAAVIGDNPLSGFVGSVTSAVQQVQSFVTATTAQVQAVLTPLAQAQARVKALIGSAEAVVASPAPLGGIAAGAVLVANAAALTAQASSMGALGPLYDMQSVLGRMQTNLVALGVAGRTVVLAGGDLYSLAAQAYGDASEWTTLAKANGLSDPMLTGVNTILVPPTSKQTGGVYPT